MRKINLDGCEIKRTVEGHTYLSRMLEFPVSYGKNLDALYDLLTEIGSDVEIWISHEGEMDQMMKKVFLDASNDNEYLKICLTK